MQYRNLTALCILSLAILAGGVQARDISMLTVEWAPHYGSEHPEQGLTSAIVKAAFKAEGHNSAVGFIPWARALNEVNNGSKSIGEVAVFVSRRQLSQQLTASTIANLITLLALVTVMAIVMTIVMNQIIIGPITRLAKHAEDISHGNLKQKIRPESHDEIGQLAEAFHRMQTSLRVAFKRIYAKTKST